MQISRRLNSGSFLRSILAAFLGLCQQPRFYDTGGASKEWKRNKEEGAEWAA